MKKKYNKYFCQGLRDDSTVKHCFCREPGFGFQCPYGHNHNFSVSGSDVFFWPPQAPVHTCCTDIYLGPYTYTQNEYFLKDYISCQSHCFINYQAIGWKLLQAFCILRQYVIINKPKFCNQKKTAVIHATHSIEFSTV